MSSSPDAVVLPKNLSCPTKLSLSAKYAEGQAHLLAHNSSRGWLPGLRCFLR